MLCADRNELGLEGVIVVASSLVKMETLRIDGNKEVMQGVGCLRWPPRLKRLDVRTA